MPINCKLRTLKPLQYLFLKRTVEATVFNILVLVAFFLLVTVTGGIAYLTLADWRDRRRQDQEKRR